jgi:hypothetical protein
MICMDLDPSLAPARYTTTTVDIGDNINHKVAEDFCDSHCTLCIIRDLVLLLASYYICTSNGHLRAILIRFSVSCD